MTSTCSAAGTGLPNTTDRRAFLATLAAAGVMTGAAVPAFAELPPAASDHPDAGLLELVEALMAAEANWENINRDAEPVFSTLDSLAPEVPAALVYQEGRDAWGICYDRNTLERQPVGGEWVPCYTKGTEARYLRWALVQWKREGTGQRFIERATEIVEAFDVYALAKKQAEEAAGLPAHEERIAANTDLIGRFNRDIASVPAITAEGVAAKARAAAVAWSIDLGYLSTDVLPDMLRGEGTYKRTEILLAVSVVVDAMKLAAPQVAA